MSINRIARYFGHDGACLMVSKAKAAEPSANEVLELAIAQRWRGSKNTLALKAGMNRETIRGYLAGGIPKKSESFDALCTVLGIDPDACRDGRLVIVAEPQIDIQRSDSVETMLNDILETPAGEVVVAQIEAVHRKLFPNNYR